MFKTPTIIAVFKIEYDQELGGEDFCVSHHGSFNDVSITRREN